MQLGKAKQTDSLTVAHQEGPFLQKLLGLKGWATRLCVLFCFVLFLSALISLFWCLLAIFHLPSMYLGQGTIILAEGHVTVSSRFPVDSAPYWCVNLDIPLTFCR